MQKGGRRPGAGRPKGAISLSTRAIIEAAESGGETPIAYMLRVMRDETIPDARRDRMARAAAAYLHSKLALIEDENDAGDEVRAAVWRLGDPQPVLHPTASPPAWGRISSVTSIGITASTARPRLPNSARTRAGIISGSCRLWLLMGRRPGRAGSKASPTRSLTPSERTSAPSSRSSNRPRMSLRPAPEAHMESRICERCTAHASVLRAE